MGGGKGWGTVEKEFRRKGRKSLKHEDRGRRSIALLNECVEKSRFEGDEDKRNWGPARAKQLVLESGRKGRGKE